jgi:hypothetical protein
VGGDLVERKSVECIKVGCADFLELFTSMIPCSLPDLCSYIFVAKRPEHIYLLFMFLVLERISIHKLIIFSRQVGAISPRHGSFSGCEWRMGLPDGRYVRTYWISSLEGTSGGTVAWAFTAG